MKWAFLGFCCFPLFFYGCKNLSGSPVKAENVAMFNEKVLDSLAYEGKNVREILKSSSPCIVYVSNNECSECIYKYIEFYNTAEHIFPTVNRLFIIEGCNETAFHFYLKRHPLVPSEKSVTIEDSLYVFQSAEQYIGDPQLFVVKDSVAIHVLTDPFQDRQHIKAFENIIKTK